MEDENNLIKNLKKKDRLVRKTWDNNEKFIFFSQTKTLQTHSNLFDLKRLNFIWNFHFCLVSFWLIYLFVAGFNRMVLIFHLDMYFVCSIKVCISNFPLIFSVLSHLNVFGYAGFSDMDLICRFFRSGRLMGRLIC